MDLTIKRTNSLQGEIRVPGDKSISHRAIMLGSLASGITEVTGFLMGQDCLSTIDCFKKLGIAIEINDEKVTIQGKGLHGLKEPNDLLDVGNSGTTIRLLSGILAGQGFTSILTGDESIRRRPMGRIIKPLEMMGANIMAREKNSLAPIAIKGGNLHSINYETPVASAQIKSALLLAGLFAPGVSEITEPEKSRDHTELMLRSFGAQVEEDGLRIRVKGEPNLKGQKIAVPGDISSAAFFLVAGAITPDSSLIIRNVGINPTRSGIIDVLKEMGANISIISESYQGQELVGDIKIESSNLKGIKIGGEIIPRLIDEIPIITVAALCAQGITEIRDAQELKVKESNRLQAIIQEFTKFGAKIEELPDGMRIHGGHPLIGATGESHGDHRIAMALAIGGLVAKGETTIKDTESIDVSFPGFVNILHSVIKD